jgi:uncharacterized protein
VSDKLPTREQALELLVQKGCKANVVKHCIAVAKLAVETAENLNKKGRFIDIELVEIGALLHDIGRSKTHSVNHAMEGAKIAQAIGLPEPLVKIIERHVGGGITHEEAKWLGWPSNAGYTPVTLEEKVVSYADKLIDGNRRVPVELTIEQFRNKGLSEAAERIVKLHDEIAVLIGDCTRPS